MPFVSNMLQHAFINITSIFSCHIVALFLLLLIISKIAYAYEPIIEHNHINVTNSDNENMTLITKNYGAILAFTTDYVVLGGKAVVSLYDPESNTSITSANVTNVNVKSITDSFGTTLRLSETGIDTGSFLGTIQVETFSSYGSAIRATVGDTLTATFTDDPDANGGVSTVTDTAIVVLGGTIQPTVTTGYATNILSNSATLNGTINANDSETNAWFEYGTNSGVYTSVSSTQNITGTSNTTVSIDISGLSVGTTYYYRLAAQNSAGTAYGSEMSFTTFDTATPTGSISINGNATYTNSTTVILTLSALDDVGVTGYYISTDSITPSASGSGWIEITSTTSYTEDISYTLNSSDGSKTIYVWYKDALGNISNYATASIILDTTTPTIIITSPTSSATYISTSNVVSLDGIAFDSTSEINSVTWVNNNDESKTATGTTSWSISNISLSSGDNVITITAYDGAENTSTDTITVTYSQPTLTPTPTVTLLPSPTPILAPTIEPNKTGIISGYVIDRRGNPIESVRIRLKGTNTKVLKRATSDEDGVFEFTDLDADAYIITALKKGYKIVKQTITLEEGEEKDIEVVIRKSSRRITFVEH